MEIWSGRRDSNPRPQPWQGCALPLSYTRIKDAPAGGSGARAYMAARRLAIATADAAAPRGSCRPAGREPLKRGSAPPATAKVPCPPRRADLLAFLDRLGIATTTVEHPPLFTVEESRALRGEIAGGHTKNLFLKDKKDRVFLVVAEEDAAIDMKTLHKRIGSAAALLRQAGAACRAARRRARLGHAVRRHQRHGAAA